MTAMKSCETCPSYIDGESPESITEIKSRFKRIPGSAICGRYGHILGSPKNTEDHNKAIRVHYGSACEAHGEAIPATPVSINLRVAKPNLEILTESVDPDEIGSCRNCVHRISDTEVMNSFGWGLPMCKAFGKLLNDERNEWKGCGYATLRTSQGVWASPPADDVELIEPFRQGFKLDSSAVIASMVSHIDLMTPPQEYVTDKPVSEADEDAGVRAWRKISDPTGYGPDKFLPIFDYDSFDPEEQAKIPCFGDDEHPEQYLDYGGLFYRFAVEAGLNETALLQGAPGLGKTEFARALAYSMGVPFERITFRQRMEADALLGSPQYDPQEGTYFQPGRLPLCYVKRNVLLLDEPNLVEDDDILHALRPLTDNSKQLVIEGASGAGQRGSWRFERHKYCFLLLAQNPSWDPRNIGTRELASADANRLSVLEIEDPPEEIVRHIVRERCLHDGYEIPEPVLDAILAISEDIRALESDGAFPDHWGTRQIIKVARKTPYYSMERAFKVAALDLYAPEVAEMVLQSIASHLPTEADLKAIKMASE